MDGILDIQVKLEQLQLEGFAAQQLPLQSQAVAAVPGVLKAVLALPVTLKILRFDFFSRVAEQKVIII